MKNTTIAVKPATKEKLAACGTTGQSFDEVLQGILNKLENIEHE